MTQEIYGLLDPKVAENSAAIRKLLEEFSSMLPSQFVKPYFVSSPPVGNLVSVLRANCSNDGCSVRAVVHIIRDNGMLKISEREPTYDRFSNPCKDCKKLF